MRKKLCALTALMLLTSLTACTGGNKTVPVERADLLAQSSMVQDRYAGMVVSEDVTKITRDTTKAIQELYVEEGDEVKSGQKLFSYDSEALKLEQSKQELELERLKKEKTDKSAQIKDLKAQLKKADKEDETLIEINLNAAEIDYKSLDYDIKAKQQEIKQIKDALKNVVVKSPVDGSIRKIDYNDTDGSGTYITIQKTGDYRIKGTLNELSLQGGVTVGSTVEILSRVDDSQVWTGTVSEIDTNSTDDGTNGGMGMGMWGPMGGNDPMTTSTNYPFYVEPDSIEGLLLGQHVYIQVVSDGGGTADGLYVPQYYLVNLNTDEETFVTTADMWVANDENILELRQVTVGTYNATNSTYEILSGLEKEEFVADPSAPGCKAGAPVDYRYPEDFTGETQEPVEEPTGGPEDGTEGTMTSAGDAVAVDPDAPGLPEGIVEAPSAPSNSGGISGSSGASTPAGPVGR